MYKQILELRPYFRSLREFNSDVSLDINVPITWDIIPEITNFPNIIYKQQDTNEISQLISYVTKKDQKGYDELLSCVKLVITFNLEREKKEKLLEEKIIELKKLFQERNLESLEKLKFEQHDSKNEERFGLSDSEGFRKDPDGDLKS